MERGIELVATLVGDKASVKVFRNPKGRAFLRWTRPREEPGKRITEVRVLQLGDLQLALDYARKVAQEGDPWA